MGTDMMHLAKITLANLTAGVVNPTEKEIIKAMCDAVLKEKSISEQLYKSSTGNRELFDAFKHEIADIFYDEVNEKQPPAEAHPAT